VELQHGVWIMVYLEGVEHHPEVKVIIQICLLEDKNIKNNNKNKS
jgi:hypothetical protein